MTIDEIHNMWEEDCVISKTQLDETSRNTPKLHAKYLRLLMEFKAKKSASEFAQKKLLKQKWLYYNGKMNKEEIENAGWEFDPFNGLKVLKGEMNHYYDADDDIQKSEMKIQYFKLCIDTLSEIIENIKWRHQTIGNMIKWRQFTEGG